MALAAQPCPRKIISGLVVVILVDHFSRALVESVHILVDLQLGGHVAQSLAESAGPDGVLAQADLAFSHRFADDGQFGSAHGHAVDDAGAAFLIGINLSHLGLSQILEELQALLGMLGGGGDAEVGVDGHDHLAFLAGGVGHGDRP